VATLANARCLRRAVVGVAVLLLGLLNGSVQAQGPTAISLSWAELDAGCEAPELAPVAFAQCQLQLAQWRADYAAPVQLPDLRPADLDQVLAELPLEAEVGLSLWSQVWRWLREQLGGGSAEVPTWLRDWQIPETFADWMLGLSVGACVLLALGIVGNELLQVYRSRAIAHIPGSSAVARSTNFGRKIPTLADLASYPLQDQPSVLLHIVLNRLQQRSMLSRQAGRTHQDLLQQAPELGELGDSLATIARAAERTTYGNWQISTAEVEPLVSAGERLVAQVDAQADFGNKTGANVNANVNANSQVNTDER
jgi:hypothetical protein